MRFNNTLATLAITGIMGLGAAMAQTPAPAAPVTAPAATAPDASAPVDKKAISKECSAQADAKGLHGKERHKFRSDCRKNGGKA